MHFLPLLPSSSLSLPLPLHSAIHYSFPPLRSGGTRALTRATSTHARTHKCTRGKWVTLSMADRPVVDAGCWHLRVYLLSGATARWKGGQGKNRSIPKDKRILFLKPSILFDIQESMMIEKHCRKYILDRWNVNVHQLIILINEI